MKRRSWILLGVLVAAMFVLAGCGVPFEGVDVSTVPPDGPWQTFVVWPLANVLLWLDGVLKGAGVPYHWGFTIILFTLLVKLITFPLSLTQIRSMEAQKTLQPQLQDLQKKYGKDREALAQAQMKLYQESGVNPLSGCLPLVIQMPILFGLYAALVAVGPNLKNAAFFWIPDLSFPSNAIGLSWIPEAWQAGDYGTLIAYMILPILLVVSQIIVQKTMTPPSTGNNEQAKMTQNMSMIMTVFFGYFTLQVPAGLSLYWVASNLLQMLQQWIVTRFFQPGIQVAAAASAAPASASASAPKQITVAAEAPAPKKNSQQPQRKAKGK